MFLCYTNSLVQVSVEKASEMAKFRKGLARDDFDVEDDDDAIGWADDPVQKPSEHYSMHPPVSCLGGEGLFIYSSLQDLSSLWRKMPPGSVSSGDVASYLHMHFMKQQK